MSSHQYSSVVEPHQPKSQEVLPHPPYLFPQKGLHHPRLRNINFIKIYQTLKIYNWESHSMGDVSQLLL